MVAVKLFLLFNIPNFYHKAFLAWNGVVKKPLKWQKCFVAAVPIFENLLCFLIAARNKPSIKNTSGFRGFIFGLALRLNIAPNRCKTLAALPDWAICWGKLVAENKKIPLEMRGKRLGGKRNACSLRNGNEYFPVAV
jgi:hypothetical protein